MSAPLASPEWVASIPGLANEVRLADFSGSIDVLVTEAPGKVRFAVEVASGEAVATSVGKAKGAPVAIEVKAATLAGMLREELDPAVAYMRGDLKLNDAYELALFTWRPTYGSEEWRSFVAALNAATTYGE